MPEADAGHRSATEEPPELTLEALKQAEEARPLPVVDTRKALRTLGVTEAAMPASHAARVNVLLAAYVASGAATQARDDRSTSHTHEETMAYAEAVLKEGETSPAPGGD